MYTRALSWFPYMFITGGATKLHFATGGTECKGTLTDEGQGFGSRSISGRDERPSSVETISVSPTFRSFCSSPSKGDNTWFICDSILEAIFKNITRKITG